MSHQHLNYQSYNLSLPRTNNHPQDACTATPSESGDDWFCDRGEESFMVKSCMHVTHVTIEHNWWSMIHGWTCSWNVHEQIVVKTWMNMDEHGGACSWKNWFDNCSPCLLWLRPHPGPGPKRFRRPQRVETDGASMYPFTTCRIWNGEVEQTLSVSKWKNANRSCCISRIFQNFPDGIRCPSPRHTFCPSLLKSQSWIQLTWHFQHNWNLTFTCEKPTNWHVNTWEFSTYI